MTIDNAEAENRAEEARVQQRIGEMTASANEASARYGYFLIAASGASLGYGLQQLDGQRWHLFAAVEILSFICWCVSILLGCLSLQNALHVQGYVIQSFSLDLPSARRSFKSEELSGFADKISTRLGGAKGAYVNQRKWQLYFLIGGVLLFAVWRVVSWIVVS